MKHIELNSDHSEKVNYNNSDYPVYISRSFLSLYPNYAAPDHWHDDIEFIIIVSGQMEYNINGEILHLHAGESLIVTSGEMHYGFSYTKTECDFICILLHPMLLCPIYSFEKDYIIPIFYNDNIPYIQLYPNISWHNEILSIVRSFHEHQDSNAAYLKILSGFASICALLYEHIPKKDKADSKQNPNLIVIKNMITFIQKNYRKKVTLPDIAHAGAVGQSKCCKLFNQYFSLSPITYLNQYRLSKSIELLKHTDLSITEISLSVGFNNASYYAETFRKWIGKSPREFRQEKSVN